MTRTKLNEFRAQTETLQTIYQGLLKTVEDLLQHPDPLSQNDILTDINSKMDNVRQIESKIAILRESLTQQNEQIPDDLSATFGSIANIIARLLPRINQLEIDARACKDKLAPSINHAARISQMKQAYTNNAHLQT